MANLRETPMWEEGIYQWETSDPVMGGENGIDNKPTRQLANRTLWLKTELAKAVASIGSNKTEADTALALKADKTHQISVGAGLTGGGDLSANRAIALTTPSTLSGSTSNWVGNGATGHTHELAQATATLAGVSKLIDHLNSTDGTAALSAKQGNVLSEQLTEFSKKSLPLGSIVGFPKEITSPVGFLKCDGSTFHQATYPDLYQALGNSNQLPNLNGEIGQVAPFAINNLPDGWLWFDDIKSQVNATSYPDLYRLLTSQYGSMDNVPNLDDRFIRNIGSDLSIGQVQDDEIKKHGHKIFSHWSQNPIFEQLGFRGTGNFQNVNQVSTITDSNLTDNGWIEPYGDSPAMTGGDETRPKSIAFKYAIKAINVVNYWIKAYGEVINSGSLNAESLALAIQEKADKNHTHSYTDITNFNDGVSQLFTYQKIGNFEIRKYPDGTMIQTLKQAISRNVREYLFTFQWAESFTEMPVLSGAYITKEASSDTHISFRPEGTNRSQATVCLFEVNYHGAPLEVHITAIGRWK